MLSSKKDLWIRGGKGMAVTLEEQKEVTKEPRFRNPDEMTEDQLTDPRY